MPDPDDIPYVKTVKRLTNINDIKDVPVIGGLYGTANAVVDYFESDCNPDWHLYVETLFPAAGTAVLALLEFGLDDILRGYFRPAGGRGFGGLGRASRRYRSPTKAQRARGLLKGGIPELGEMTGRKLPGAKLVQARKVGNAEKFLWKVDGLAQRGLWYWMVADILEDFTVNWTSGLMRSKGCIGVDVGGVVRTGSVVGVIGHQPFAFIDVPTVQEEWGSVTHTIRTFRAPAGFNGHMAFTGSWTPELPGSGPSQLLISGQHTQFGSHGATFNPETGRWDDFVTMPIVGGETYTIGAFNSDGWVTWHDLEVVFIVAGGPSS